MVLPMACSFDRPVPELCIFALTEDPSRVLLSCETHILPRSEDMVLLAFPEDSCNPKEFVVDRVILEYDVMGFVRSTVLLRKPA